MDCFPSGRYCQSAGHFLVVEQAQHIKTALRATPKAEATDRQIDQLVYALTDYV